MITRNAIREIRSFALRNDPGYSAVPIQIVNGRSKPVFSGRSGRYETKTGKPVHYPNAYRRAWGKPIYVPSTRHIQVGKDWLRQLELDLIQLSYFKKTKRIVDRSCIEFEFNFA